MIQTKNLIESKLRERTIEQLKEDIRVAGKNEEEGSNIIFCLGLNILEEKINEDDYTKFEDSL